VRREVAGPFRRFAQPLCT